MAGYILGKKVNQTQAFDDDGVRIPVTFIETALCYLIDVWTTKPKNCLVMKLGFGQTKSIKKPVQGELNKAGIKIPLHFLREFRFKGFPESIKTFSEDKRQGLQIGDQKIFTGEKITPGLFFKKGDLVDVSGISKGKGFQGVVKRHHFAGGSKTHGQSDRLRAPGAIGSTTTPGRVYKGKRMAGRMGGERKTLKNLKVVEVNDKGILVKGLIPGAKRSLIEVRQDR